jgi:hypothetical protein
MADTTIPFICRTQCRRWSDHTDRFLLGGGAVVVCDSPEESTLVVPSQRASGCSWQEKTSFSGYCFGEEHNSELQRICDQMPKSHIHFLFSMKMESILLAPHFFFGKITLEKNTSYFI